MTGTVLYEVRRARDQQELAAALELRHDVFCIEQGVPEHEEVDGRDHDGIHLVAVSGEKLLGTCRLLLIGGTAQFSRLAVQRSAPQALPGVKTRSPRPSCLSQSKESKP